MELTNQQRLGRAKNAVLDFFEKRLSVPKIYIDPKWGGLSLDVLAIDRDGVGDVHAVLLYNRYYGEDELLDIFNEQKALKELLDQFSVVPAQYKYVGAVHAFAVNDWGRDDVRKHGLPTFFLESSLSADGIGRVGFISIGVPTHGELNTSLDVKPERFRVSVGQLADDYVKSHTPDWEIRA